jgi:hypothetical protein
VSCHHIGRSSNLPARRCSCFPFPRSTSLPHPWKVFRPHSESFTVGDSWKVWRCSDASTSLHGIPQSLHIAYCSQEPPTGPYPESTESNPLLPPAQPVVLRSILSPSSHPCFGFPSGLFPWGFPTKILHIQYSIPSRACHMSRPPRSPWFDRPHGIWGWGSSLYNFLHSPVTSSLFGPDTLLRTVLKHPQSLLFPWCERPRFTPIFPRIVTDFNEKVQCRDVSCDMATRPVVYSAALPPYHAFMLYTSYSCGQRDSRNSSRHHGNAQREFRTFSQCRYFLAPAFFTPQINVAVCSNDVQTSVD